MKQNRKTTQPLLFVLLLTALVLVSCDPGGTATPAPVTEPPATTVQEIGSVEVFFSSPETTHAHNYEGGPDEVLAAAIDGAKLSIDIAMYSLNLWSIRDALLRAYRRGVAIRMVMETDNMDAPEVQELQGAGISILGDQQEGLMHDKYMIIDHAEVWTGSLNYTVGSAYRDNNNLIHIRSIQEAAAYTKNFEGMYLHKRFGPQPAPNTPVPGLPAINPTPHPVLDLSGTQMEVYFPPVERAEPKILELIQGAKDSIYFMAYAFTSNELGDALVQQSKGGIIVQGVMDESQIQTGQGTEYDPFMQAGLDVRIDGNTDGLMHHKVIIIDGKIVITGSYNFTASAETSNEENAVILYSRDVANKYMEEFQRVWGQAKQP